MTLRKPLIIAAVCFALNACDTPINDADLPPQAEPETSSEPDPTDEPEITSEPEITGEPDVGPSADDASALAHDALLPDVDPSDAAPIEDGLSTPPLDIAEGGDSGDEVACEGEALCHVYWETYSACLIQVGGPEAAIEPSFYSDGCGVTCDFEGLLDYEAYYTCMIDGIPEDCAAEGVDEPDCELQ